MARTESFADREARFIQAILANPEDAATREVFADWLEENGRDAHAEFVRVQLTARSGVRADPGETRFVETSVRLAMLGADWHAGLALALDDSCPLTPHCSYARAHRFSVICPARWKQGTSAADARACKGDETFLCMTAESVGPTLSHGHCALLWFAVNTT